MTDLNTVCTFSSMTSRNDLDWLKWPDQQNKIYHKGRVVSLHLNAKGNLLFKQEYNKTRGCNQLLDFHTMETKAFWSDAIICGDNGAWLHQPEGGWGPGTDLSQWFSTFHSVKPFHLVHFLWLPWLSKCCLCSCLFSDTEPVASRMLWINNEFFFSFLFCQKQKVTWGGAGGRWQLNTSFPVRFLSVSICNSTSSRIYAQKEMSLLRSTVWIHNVQHIRIRGSTVTLSILLTHKLKHLMKQLY